MQPIRTRNGRRPPINNQQYIPIQTRTIPTRHAVSLMNINTGMPFPTRCPPPPMNFAPRMPFPNRRRGLPPMSGPPPKIIKTVVLGPDSESTETSPDSGISEDQSARTANFAQRWLARNQLLSRPKIEVRLDEREEVVEKDEIMTVDSDSSVGSIDECGSSSSLAGNDQSMVVEVDDDVEMIEFKQEPVTPVADKKSPQAALEVIDISDDDDDEGCVISIEQCLAAKKRQPTKQRPLSKRIVSKQNMEPTTSQIVFNQIMDGFSRDCHLSKRAVRQWVEANILDGLTKIAPISTDLTICSYNVLCQKTISRTGYLYRHLDFSPKYLEWNYRWKGLKAELPRFDADILGLQEVQYDHFGQFYEPLMRKNGYDGFYTQKFGTAQKDDGCALFWRPTKFEMLRMDSVVYFVCADAVSNRENIGQVATLRCKTTSEVLLVANTHLIFNEERGDVKLAQLAILFANIHKIKMEVEKTLGDVKPVIVVMGDFNIEPESKVYKFVTEGELLIDKVPIRTMSGQSFRCGGQLCDASRLLDFTQIDMNSMFLSPNSKRSKTEKNLSHPFDLVSAYHYNQPSLTAWEKRPISTYHKQQATPDFIFYTPEEMEGIEKMQLLSRYSLPTVDTLAPVTPWPNKHVPSDHLPIIAKFRLSKLN